MTNINGNGGATAVRTISGRGLVHRHLDKRQLACLAADVRADLAIIRHTDRQLADIFGVSVTYIVAAAKLSSEKRKAILKGWDPTSFAELLNPPATVLALPAPNTPVSDAELAYVIRAAGLDRTLAVAIAVEGATVQP